MCIPFHITKTFERNWQSKKKIVVNRGGTRSGKTYCLCQLFANWLMTGYIRDGEYVEKGVASIVRKYKSSLKNTVMRDFEEVLQTTMYEGTNISIYSQINHHKTDRTYSYKGRTVEFFGADDQQKIRGYKSKILYCNEANELAFKKEFFQLLMRTETIVFIDFNPSDPYVWINEEIEQKRAHTKGDVEVIVSTYENNRKFLTTGQIEEIEYLKQTAPDLWQVYGLGEYGLIAGLIFPKVTIIDRMPDDLKNQAFGKDFGFTNDPTTLYDCGTLGRDLFIDELLYSSGYTNPMIIKHYQALGIEPRYDEIFADSANPKDIQEIANAGYNIKPAKKGPDSILFGINTLKQYNIHITARSTGIIKEQKKYKWAEDKEGNPTNKPIDNYNHGWDSVRYYGMEKLTTNKKRRRKTFN